jgi:Protein of unknown function (DUF4232)
MVVRPALAVAVIFLAGCTSGGRSPAEKSGGPTSSKSTASEQTAAPCAASDLWLAAGPQESATGHGLVTVVVANRGKNGCVLAGFPSVDLVAHDSVGHETSRFHATRADGGFMLNTKSGVDVLLAPDGTAFFGIETTHICQPDTTLPTGADHLEVSINGEAVDFGASPLPVEISSCGGAGVGTFRAQLRDVSYG